MTAYEFYKELLRRAEVFYLAHSYEIKAEKKKVISARYYAKHQERIRAKVNADRALNRASL